MSAAAQIVKESGSIIIATECWDGIPEHGGFGTLLRGAKSLAELLARIESPGFASADQWQAQIQAKIQMKADVYVRADGLSDGQITEALLKSCPRIEDTLAELIAKYHNHPSICVMPEGPLTIPYILNYSN